MRKHTTRRPPAKDAAPPDLAELLAAVLAHPELPGEWLGGILEGLDQTLQTFEGEYHYDRKPEFIRLILGIYWARKYDEKTVSLAAARTGGAQGASAAAAAG